MQEVPGNANLWVNPPHLIVLLFVCDIDSSGGDQEPPCPSFPLCILPMCLFTDGLPHIYLRLFSLGFNTTLTPEAKRGCNYMQCNNKTKQMRKMLHQRAYNGEDARSYTAWLLVGVKLEMRVMDALRLNTSKSPLQAALFLPGSVSECVRESVQD